MGTTEYTVLDCPDCLVLADAQSQLPAPHGVLPADPELHVLRQIAANDAGLKCGKRDERHGRSGGERLEATSVDGKGPRVCVAELASDVDHTEPPDAGVREGIERVVGEPRGPLPEDGLFRPARARLRGAGVEPDELGVTADLDPVGPVPPGPGRDRGGNLVIEVEQLVSPRSVAGSHVECPHARGNSRPCHRAPTMVIPPNCAEPDDSVPDRAG